MGAVVVAVLWLAPCATDYCLEVQGRPFYAFTDSAECEQAADQVRTDTTDWWAWCEPIGDPL